MGSKWLRNSFIYLLILVAIVAIFFTLFQPSYGAKDADLSTVIDMANKGQIDKLEIQGDILLVTTKTGERLSSRKESGASFVDTLQRGGVKLGADGMRVSIKDQSQWGGILSFLLNFLPIIIFGALLLFMMRQAQGGNSQALNFGRSRARMFVGNKPTVTFNDVAGVEESKQELQEVVEFLKFPEKFAALGARIPKGVLLVGPPGTGKTLLARAVAGEAGVPFFSISGSEFVEMFVGVGAARVRDLFDQAKRNAPCIIFIDEIDAVGRHRGAGLGGGHDEREQTLNQILVEMDGFDNTTNVIVVAATNRPDILDPALLRPGRFDRRVVLDLPSINGRKQILEVHVKGKPLGPDVNLLTIGKETAGFSGADLANLVNEAAILAARRNKKLIGAEEFAEAVDRVVAGPQRRSRVISVREKEITAFHEAGHALVARMQPIADMVHKVSIVARGTMGGYTRLLPQEDRTLMTKLQFEAMLAVALGGRRSEQLIFDETTTGASNDLEHATRLARQMVTQYGMSEKLGPRTFGRKEELVFLGREISEQRDYSDKVAEVIDSEVERLIQEAYQKATDILTANKAKLVQLALRLVTEETIEADALDVLFNSEAPPLPNDYKTPRRWEKPAAPSDGAEARPKSAAPEATPAAPPAPPQPGRSGPAGMPAPSGQPAT
ncbi:MAG: ATP-dependent zinc metalloprotease FtsH [Dehalococcoidia bacterium]|nr:ATP-dependent zinc metalloprotease FtsH [Dehalococcoidia bacterium]